MMSYNASCFFSNSESTSESPVIDDTRASSCMRSRDRFGTRPYRTAKMISCYLMAPQSDSELTIPRHPHGQAFLETAVLTSISIQAVHHALAISQAPVLDLLLDTAPKESLKRQRQVLESMIHILACHGVAKMMLRLALSF